MSYEGRTSIKIPPDLKKLLDDEAKKQNRSIHNLIITILRDYFESR